MQYESSFTSGLKDMAKVKVFVHATDVEGRAMTLAPWTYLLAKKFKFWIKKLIHFDSTLPVDDKTSI